MKIGFVSFWFNRGQAFVTRALRSIYREAGHETFVLARPDRLKARVRTDDVWAEDGVEVASGNEIPAEEYLAWARRRGVEVCFLFQNEQYAEIEALRRSGVVTVGTFMWEKFRAEEVPAALRAYDTVYAMNACDADRYARLGILAPRVRWGCWPEILGREVTRRPPGDPVVFYYPAGYLETRRAIRPTVEAFLRAGADGARLLVKSVRPVPEEERIHDPRVTWHGEDLSREAYLDLLRSCDVCLSNTRWEGLGLVIYEAIAMGLPVIAPDFPPMSENVRHGLTGLLVPLRRFGRGAAPSGIPAADVSRSSLSEAIRRLAERRTVEAMSANALRLRDDDYSWDRTREDFLRLLDRAVSRAAAFRREPSDPSRRDPIEPSRRDR